MHDLARKAARKVQKKYPTPLSILFDCFGIKPEEMETIKITQMDTKWESPMRVRIAGDKKTALKEEEDDNVQVKCYSDGSGYQRVLKCRRCCTDGRALGGPRCVF